MAMACMPFLHVSGPRSYTNCLSNTCCVSHVLRHNTLNQSTVWIGQSLKGWDLVICQLCSAAADVGHEMISLDNPHVEIFPRRGPLALIPHSLLISNDTLRIWFTAHVCFHTFTLDPDIILFHCLHLSYFTLRFTPPNLFLIDSLSQTATLSQTASLIFSPTIYPAPSSGTHFDSSNSELVLRYTRYIHTVNIVYCGWSFPPSGIRSQKNIFRLPAHWSGDRPR